MAHATQHEEELIRRARQGDAAAFDRLVEVYAPRVYAMAFRLVGKAEDAEDIAQEAFLRIYDALPKFRGDAAFSTWMYRIVSNVCYDELKRRRRRPAPFCEFTRDGDEGEEPETPAHLPQTDTTEELLEQRERQATLQQAIASLPEPFRMVLVLYDLQGLSYQEIADVLRQNLGTIKSRLNRARLLLREKLSNERELFGVSESRT